jgi:hypothetical protein
MKAMLIMRGGKPMDMTCHDTNTSRQIAGHGLAVAAAEQRRMENARKYFGVKDGDGFQFSGQHSRRVDLEFTDRAPDGVRNWTKNNDFVKWQKERGHPQFQKTEPDAKIRVTVPTKK